jgi:SAM-dependent methyltransferase
MAEPGADRRARAAWEVDDQFRAQCASPAGRALIEARWGRIGEILDAWAQAGNAPPRACLDAGCGDGINLVGLGRLVAQRGWSTVLHGTDRNPVRLARAAVTGACLTRGSLLALPYPRHAFDAVLCNHVIEHIPESEGAFAELRRVLRPGGVLIVGVPNEGCALARLRNHVLQRRILATTDHVHFFTAASLSRALVAAGFVAPAIAVEEFFWPHMALARLVQAHAVGRMLSRALGRVLPGQAAGLIAHARG